MILTSSDLKTLEIANSHYANRKYLKAMQYFGELSKRYPNNEEFNLYILLCDIATENEEKSNMFYDYFTVAKTDNIDNAIEYVKGMIKAYDGDIEEITKLLNEISSVAVDSLDAIDYKDFLELVKSRGSFKEAFEDIMFSTKVAITSKDDFFDFITKLIDNDFKSSAYSYLDGFNQYFSYDTKIQELYKKLEEKTNANNNHQ
jgi:tetratricopeptide (TPR) repeat protein